jgi:hypothetical protein
MCAQLSRVGHPYKLSGSRLAFTNWHYVQAGTFGWFDQNGNDITVKGEQGPDEAMIKRRNHPWGIQLKVNEAERSGPIFTLDREWEQDGMVISTILKDGGIYKAWATTSYQSSLPNKGAKYLLYYESADGVNWNGPDCGIVEFKGSTKNNILHEGRTQPGIQFGGQVFIDPTSIEERYKMVCEAEFSREDYERYKAERPEALDGIVNPESVRGIQGAVSPDGIHWTLLSDPLLLTMADTQVVAYYDTTMKKYVIYSREWAAGPQAEEARDELGMETTWHQSGRRAINRSESDDFRRFTLPELIVEALPMMPPHDTLYANCRTAIPGAPEQHLMFPMVWTMGSSDKMYVMLYSSFNGKNWNPLSLDPVFKTAEFGAWDGGCMLYVTPNLVELANGDYALPYTGWSVPHKYPRVNAKRNVGYMVWPKGRLVGINAKEKGEFTTVAVIPPGGKLCVNAVTDRAGGITVEVCDLHGVPIQGRESANCIPIMGDAFKQQVKWNDADDLGITAGQPVILRFYMEMATLYSLDFE